VSASRLLAVADPEPPPAAPAVIDEVHLGRMTLGDTRLEREILEIFVRQIGLTLTRIAGAAPAVAAAAAHTLKGSARGIGTWRLAHAAEQVEAAAGRGNAEVLSAATAELKAACLEVCAAIDVRLGKTNGAGRALD